MEFFVSQFKWIMLAAGLVTMTMLQAAVAPRACFKALIGEEPQGDAALLIARNWGVLVASSGALLIWGAFHAEVRTVALLIAIVGKGSFVGLCLGHPTYRAKARLAIAIDGLLVVLFAAYLIVA